MNLEKGLVDYAQKQPWGGRKRRKARADDRGKQEGVSGDSCTNEGRLDCEEDT